MVNVERLLVVEYGFRAFVPRTLSAGSRMRPRSAARATPRKADARSMGRVQSAGEGAATGWSPVVAQGLSRPCGGSPTRRPRRAVPSTRQRPALPARRPAARPLVVRGCAIIERGAWTDERIDEKMTAIDNTFNMLRDELHGLREDNREQFAGLRSDMTSLQDRLIQIGFGLVGVLLAAMVALIVALA